MGKFWAFDAMSILPVSVIQQNRDRSVDVEIDCVLFLLMNSNVGHRKRKHMMKLKLLNENILHK